MLINQINTTDTMSAISPTTADKLTELMREVAAATENFDSEYMNELTSQVQQMKAIFPDHDYIVTMEEWLEEAREIAGELAEYEQIKRKLIPELIRFFNGDTDTAEEVAEEMAWSLVYV